MGKLAHATSHHRLNTPKRRRWMMDKKRRRAYRMGISGALYHSDGDLSMLTIGLPTGDERNLRKAYAELKRRINRLWQCKIEDYCTWVTKTDDKGTRCHAHIIWTSPLWDWNVLMEIWGNVNGGADCSIYNRGLASRHIGRAVRYALQYSSAQKGEVVRFSQSKGWRPQGAENQWRAMMSAFHKPIPEKAVINDAKCLERLSRGSPEWVAALIKDYDAWVLEQRDNRNAPPLTTEKQGVLHEWK